MITINSLMETINKRYFPISAEINKDNKNELLINIFTGSPLDGDTLIAKFNMKTLDLEIANTAIVNVGDTLWDTYDFSDVEEQFVINYEDATIDYESFANIVLNSNITDEQLFIEILIWISSEIELRMEILKDNLQSVDEIITMLAPMVF